MALPELSDQDRNWYILQGYEIHETNHGSRMWVLNGLWHREDGPAYYGSHGYVNWYLNHRGMTEEEHQIAVQEIRARRYGTS